MLARVVAERPALLQTVRAAHALTEAGLVLAVTAEEAARYQWLSRWFPVAYEQSDGPALQIVVDHKSPRVAVGDVMRALLFPHAIIDAYKASWGERSVRFGFAGLGTPKRRAALRDWASRNGLRTKWRRDFHATFTAKGRAWPQKGWDADYVQQLGRTQFAICPNGDFVWTYRFFEAAAAGAIPVVEEPCGLYDGFEFYTFADSAQDFEWNAQAAEHNAALARDRLTVPHADLAAAIRAELRA